MGRQSSNAEGGHARGEEPALRKSRRGEESALHSQAEEERLQGGLGRGETGQRACGVATEGHLQRQEAGRQGRARLHTGTL